SLIGSGKDFPNNISSRGLLSSYNNSKDAQQELSSSMATHSVGVPNMAFNSMDYTVSDSSPLNR
ncbi:hypothetical protein Ancab_002477, partial [Ancistrocladus abbreviatus]